MISPMWFRSNSQVGEHHVNVDTPDTAPTEDEPAPPKKNAGRSDAREDGEPQNTSGATTSPPVPRSN